MFCHKCGAQLVNGAAFCQKCGAKTVNSEPASAPVEVPPKPATPTPPANPAAPQTATQPPIQPAPQWTAEPQYAVPSPAAPVAKKKSKAPFIAIGAVVLVIVAVLVVVLNWEGQTDYIASVKAHTPFASQNLEYTYQEVLDQYLPGAEWISQEIDGGRDVIVNGKLAGTEASVFITVEAVPDPDDEDILWMRPQSVQVDSCQTSDKEGAVEFLLALFLAYDKGHETVPDFPELLLAIGMPEEVELTETYTNEDEGISFQYPSAWKQFSSQEMKEMGGDDSTLAAFANVVDFFPELSSGMEVLKFEDSQEAADVLYLDDEEFAKTWSSKINISETSLMEIDGVSVRKLIYTEEDGDRYRSYLYSNGSTLYRINFVRSGAAEDDLADYFDAVMDTFSIDLPPLPVKDMQMETFNRSGITFQYPADWEIMPKYSITEVVRMTTDQIEFQVYKDNVGAVSTPSGDAKTISQAFTEEGVCNVMLGDVLAEVTNHPSTVDSQERFEVIFHYTVGGETYAVQFSCEDSRAARYIPTFVAVMESYAVTIPEPTPAPAQGTASILNEKEATYYMEDDNYCELHLDPLNYFSFGLKVNLYEGIGTCSGIYTVTDEGYHCKILGDHFQGFLGQDVYEFDLIKTGGGLQYKGEPMGTIRDGTMFYE